MGWVTGVWCMAGDATSASGTAQRPQPLRESEVWRRAEPRTSLLPPTLGRMRVLLTGAAGFIGTATARRAAAPRRRGRRCRPPAARGARGRHPCSATRGSSRARHPSTPGSGPRCSTGSTSSSTWPRWSAPGSRHPTCRCTPGTTTSARHAVLAAMHERGVGRLVQASSMVVYGEGRYRCPEHGDQAPAATQPASRWRRGVSTTRARSAARALGWALVDESTPARPAQLVRREQGGPGALRGGVGTPVAGCGRSR